MCRELDRTDLKPDHVEPALPAQGHLPAIDRTDAGHRAQVAVHALRRGPRRRARLARDIEEIPAGPRLSLVVDQVRRAHIVDEGMWQAATIGDTQDDHGLALRGRSASPTEQERDGNQESSGDSP